MGNFNRGGSKRFGDKKGGFRQKDRSDRSTMHQAICADCGKECSVPFNPTGDKPVFCSNCFGKKEGSNSRFNRRDSRPSFGDKKMFKAICDKCHEECEVPFKPSGDKPIFCNNCFSKSDRGAVKQNTNSESFQKQFELLNTKLDNILQMLSNKVDKKVKVEKSVIKKVVKKAVTKSAPTKKVTNKKKK